jgi:hypothetical protein
MRTLLLLLLLPACAGSAVAAERGGPGRFEARSVRITVADTATPEHPSSRFTLSGRLAVVPREEARNARFVANAAVKVATATCGPVGDLVFRNGFEGN